MIIIHPANLSATLDATADAFFNQRPISPEIRQEIASLIISRQCQSGKDNLAFLPFAAESENPLRLYTGEELKTDFARSHILLIESTRILTLLELDNHAVAQSIQAATKHMARMCYSRFCTKGECKVLTIEYMRLLALDRTSETEEQISNHLARLSAERDGKGRWGGFPFYFTLLMLLDFYHPQAIQELQYSAPECRKIQSQNWPSNPFSTRRQAILEKVLVWS
jgi:hypothetical protein